ncbi:transposase domain-containing protein [Streptomyces sp. NPDC058735]|uniref:transposase domain-containing protein n=1 Tax=unclassified Streptomyces TaxID=2593676 RepID=UPI0036C92D19
MTRTVGVAAGVFAPGHIGELTRIIPIEMVDEVLAATGAVQRRVRLLPARVTVYLLLAGALFNGSGYRQVLDRLRAGLSGLATVGPSGSALRQARQRLGPAPVKALCDLASGPAVTTAVVARRAAPRRPVRAPGVPGGRPRAEVAVRRTGRSRPPQPLARGVLGLSPGETREGSPARPGALCSKSSGEVPGVAGRTGGCLQPLAALGAATSPCRG